MYMLEDDMTLRVTHLTKHMRVDMYVSDILRGLWLWSRDASVANGTMTALSWALRVRDRHLRVDHHAYPADVTLGRDFKARVCPLGRVSVFSTHGGEICRFNATHAVYLAMEALEPSSDERVDDWILRIDGAAMDSESED